MAVNRSVAEATKYADQDEFAIEDRPSSSEEAPKPSRDMSHLSGWEVAEATTSYSGEYARDFRWAEKYQVVKFIDTGGPFLSFKQHFVSEKQRSYVCLNSVGDPQGCPLCTMGHKPSDRRAFSIINIATKKLEILSASSRLYKALHAAEFSPQGPLPKNYWALSRSGQKQNTVYNLQAIKTRDLEEDWEFNLKESDELVATFEPLTPDAVYVTPFDDLKTVAQEIAD